MSYSEPPPPQYGAPQPPPYGGQPQGTNKQAIWALVTGIIGLICCTPVGIAAIFLGRSAQAEIARTGQQGAGLAKAGFILGIIDSVLLVLGIILYATGALTFNFDS